MIKFNDAPFVPCNDCANWESCQEEAYRKGASDMENAKQIIIDSLLSEKEQIRADVIDEFANWLVEQGILGSRCICDGEITDYGKLYAERYKKQLKE